MSDAYKARLVRGNQIVYSLRPILPSLVPAIPYCVLVPPEHIKHRHSVLTRLLS